MQPNSRREYRVHLIYADGSTRLWDFFHSKEKMETKLCAISRRPGVRYHCEEWTAAAPNEDVFDGHPVLVAEYDV